MLFRSEYYLRLNNGGRFARTVFWLRGKFVRRVRKTLRAFGLDHGYYSSLDQNWRGVWSKQLRKLSGHFDVVIVEYVFNSRALEAFGPGTRKLLDTHDVFADRHQPFVARGFRQGYWISLSPQDEAAGLRVADTVLAIQQEEAGNFRRQLSESGGKERNPDVVVVSHFLDMRPPVSEFGADHVALYVGTNMLSNQISMQDFLDHVLPRVMKEIPDFTCREIGRASCRERV